MHTGCYASGSISQSCIECHLVLAARGLNGSVSKYPSYPYSREVLDCTRTVPVPIQIARTVPGPVHIFFDPFHTRMPVAN